MPDIQNATVFIIKRTRANRFVFVCY